MLAVTGAVALIAGCGGDDGGGDKNSGRTATTATASGPPQAKEGLPAAAQRLEQALAGGDCKALAQSMLHSVARGRGVDPDTPPTAEECRYIRGEAGNVGLSGLDVSKVKEFGPAGVGEGSGDHTHRGEISATVWLLDTDGSWKTVFNAALVRPQIGFSRPPGHFEGNARKFVAALATADCDTSWRLVNVASRFFGAAGGDKAKYCEQISNAYKDDEKTNGIADLASDPAAEPKELGTLADLAFYGLELESGRYLVLVLGGRIGGVADAEQKDHADPSVLEFLTVRRPSE